MTGDPKPPHVTQLFKAGDLWGWGCTCRASDGTHETRALAVQGADWHKVHGVAGLPRVCSHGIYHHGCPSCDRQDPEDRLLAPPPGEPDEGER